MLMVLYRDIKMSSVMLNMYASHTLASHTLASHTLASHIKSLEKYMFSSKNTMKYNKCVIELEKYDEEILVKKPFIMIEHVTETKSNIVLEPVPEIEPVSEIEPVPETKPIIVSPSVAETNPIIVSAEKTKQIKKRDEYFIPFQKDKLFWCFYILLKGFSEYEMHRTGFYAVEKAFKITTVEKLRGMKKEIKDLKLKISEVEDELVNKEQITLKGLQVLCLVYKVSITYIYGKKYCEFLYNDTIGNADAIIKGIIKQTERKEHALIYEDAIDLPKIKQTHWFIENVQKPLKAPASYTLKDLQDICEKLEIPIKNEIGKSKTKKDLYEGILSKL